MTGEQHTFKRFDQELKHLSSVVLRVGGLVEDQIAKAMTALREADVEAARNVVARDHVVNFLDVQADEQIVNLLALRQPVGKDLRMILSLGKTVTDLGGVRRVPGQGEGRQARQSGIDRYRRARPLRRPRGRARTRSDGRA